MKNNLVRLCALTLGLFVCNNLVADPIHTAAKTNNIAMLEQELNRGVDVNKKDADGNTALIWAVRKGMVNALEKLLSVPGIDVNIQDKDGMTALSYADKGYRSAKRIQMSEMLRAKGATKP